MNVTYRVLYTSLMVFIVMQSFASNIAINPFYVLDLEQSIKNGSGNIGEIANPDAFHTLWNVEIVMHNHTIPWTPGSKNADFEIHIMLREYPDCLENIFERGKAFFAYAFDSTARKYVNVYHSAWIDKPLYGNKRFFDTVGGRLYSDLLSIVLSVLVPVAKRDVDNGVDNPPYEISIPISYGDKNIVNTYVIDGKKNLKIQGKNQDQTIKLESTLNLSNSASYIDSVTGEMTVSNDDRLSELHSIYSISQYDKDAWLDKYFENQNTQNNIKKEKNALIADRRSANQSKYDTLAIFDYSKALTKKTLREDSMQLELHPDCSINADWIQKNIEDAEDLYAFVKKIIDDCPSDIQIVQLDESVLQLVSVCKEEYLEIMFSDFESRKLARIDRKTSGECESEIFIFNPDTGNLGRYEQWWRIGYGLKKTIDYYDNKMPHRYDEYEKDSGNINIRMEWKDNGKLMVMGNNRTGYMNIPKLLETINNR